MSELSPAAQAVMDAAVLPCTIRQGIAAGLIAANAQIPPLRYAADYIEHLLAIAADLEGQPFPQPPSQPTTEPC